MKSPDGWAADDNIPSGWSDVKSPDGWAANENIPNGWRERADKRLSILRARMVKESQRIIEYLDLKKINETLEDIRRER